MPSVLYVNATQTSYAGEDIAPGDVVCIKVSEPYVYYIATTAALAEANGEYAGVCLTPCPQGTAPTVQTEGYMQARDVGLTAGAAGDVYIGADGRLTRTQPTPTTDPVGKVDTLGNAYLNRIEVTGFSIGPGAANTVLRMDSLGATYGWAKIANANVAPNANILASSGGNFKVISSFGAQNHINTGYWEPQYELYSTPPAGLFSTVGLIRLRQQYTEIRARNAANTGDLRPYLGSTSVDFWSVGGYDQPADYSPTISLRAVNSVAIRAVTVRTRDINTFGTAFTIDLNATGATTWTFASTVTGVTWGQSTTASATGNRFSWTAQGAATTGGNIRLSGGVGSTEANRGAISIQGQITGSTLATPFRLGLGLETFSSDANKTISNANIANPILIVSSSAVLTATRSLFLPLLRGALYAITNNTSGGQAIRALASTGTGVTIANGSQGWVYCDGTNYIQISGATGAAGANGANGSNGSNGTNGTDGVGATQTSYASNGTFSVPAGTTRVDLLLIGAGGGGGGGGGGGSGAGSPNDSYDGGGGGGGGGAGAPGEHVFLPLYPVTASGTLAITIGANGTAGTGGRGGEGAVPPPTGNGADGTNGAAGGSTTAGVIAIAGGNGGSYGAGGVAIDLADPIAPGAGGAGGSGSTSGGNGGAGTNAAPPGNDGGSTTGVTNSSVRVRTIYGNTNTGFYSGTLTGAGNASGGAYGSSASIATSGGGGAGGSPTTVRYLPYEGSVTAGVGGAGGAGGAGSIATNGADGTSGTHAGLGGAGGGGGGGGGGVNAVGGDGGDGGGGASGRCIVFHYSTVSES